MEYVNSWLCSQDFTTGPNPVHIFTFNLYKNLVHALILYVLNILFKIIFPLDSEPWQSKYKALE